MLFIPFVPAFHGFSSSLTSSVSVFSSDNFQFQLVGEEEQQTNNQQTLESLFCFSRPLIKVKQSLYTPTVF